MAEGVDELIDRRRLRRKVTWWRVATLVALAAFVLALAGATGVFDRLTSKGRDHIARVKIEGVISNDRDMIKLLADLRKRPRVRAVILDISSPGGTTVGGEAYYEEIRRLAADKPVAASVGTLAASAGYMIASATDRIVARRSSIVGSIGVLFQYGDVSVLMDRIGVEVDAVKSSPLKAEPSPFQPASEEAKAMLGRIVDDSYNWFVGLVAERRKIDPGKARALADGSIFTGAQGLANGLVDEIGDEDTARKWLVSERGISDDLKIVEWKPQRNGSAFSNPASLAPLLRLLGFEPPAASAGKLLENLEKRLFLDGLVSLMQIDALTSRGEMRQ